MNENQAVAYTGEFEVEDADFTLLADRFIVRAGEISFAMSGDDDSGKFSIDGVATRTSSDIYETSEIPLVYMGYNSGDLATVRFAEIRPTEKAMRCYVSGEWKQDGKKWTFSATLDRMRKTAA